MNMKREIMEAYFATIQNRTAEGDELAVGNFVEDTDGVRYVVEAISQNYEDVKDHDPMGQGAAWIKHNDLVTEAQTWVALKNVHGEVSVNRYSDNGVTKVEVQDFDRKPEHVKTDRSIMEAYANVVNEKTETTK